MPHITKSINVIKPKFNGYGVVSEQYFNPHSETLSSCDCSDDVKAPSHFKTKTELKHIDSGFEMRKKKEM